MHLLLCIYFTTQISNSIWMGKDTYRSFVGFTDMLKWLRCLIPFWCSAGAKVPELFHILSKWTNCMLKLLNIYLGRWASKHVVCSGTVWLWQQLKYKRLMILGLKKQGPVSTHDHPLWYDTYRSEAVQPPGYYWNDDKIKKATQSRLILIKRPLTLKPESTSGTEKGINRFEAKLSRV